MNEKTKVAEDGADLGININRANRIKAQQVLDTFFKPLEAKSKMVGYLVSDAPRTIKFIREGHKPMEGVIVDKNNMEFTDKKVKRKISELKENDYDTVIETVKNIAGEDIEVI